MKVKIKKCSFNRIWYKKLINKEFEVMRNGSHFYGEEVLHVVDENGEEVLHVVDEKLSGKFILLKDTNYKTAARKQKLDKLNEISKMFIWS